MIHPKYSKCVYNLWIRAKLFRDVHFDRQIYISRKNICINLPRLQFCEISLASGRPLMNEMGYYYYFQSFISLVSSVSSTFNLIPPNNKNPFYCPVPLLYSLHFNLIIHNGKTHGNYVAKHFCRCFFVLDSIGKYHNYNQAERDGNCC